MNFDTFCIVGLVRWLITTKIGTNSPWYYIIFGLCVLTLMIVPYFLGGINFAIIISKKKFNVDIRNFGSGNAGTTNMRRTFGKKFGVITFVGDVCKTIVACLLGYLLLGLLGAFIAGLFCMVGHMFPAMYKFKGGKGIACMAAVLLMTDLGTYIWWHIPFLFIIMFACFAFIILATKYVSLGSIMCMLIYPLFLNGEMQLYFSSIKEADMENHLKDLKFSVYITDYWLYLTIALLMSILIIFMHRKNISRLLHGEESKFELKTRGKKTLYEESEESKKSK